MENDLALLDQVVDRSLLTSCALLAITATPLAIWWFRSKSSGAKVIAARWTSWMVITVAGATLVIEDRLQGEGFFVGYLIFWAIIWAIALFETVRLASPARSPQRVKADSNPRRTRALIAAIWMLAISVSCWQLTNLGAKAFVLFFVVALFDIGGWVGGKTLGRLAPFSHRIFPTTSPNKTLGGLFVSILFGAAAWWWVFTGFGLLGASGKADPFGFMVLAVFAIFGDWFESKLKRLAGVKDAGTIVPGFGGVLDRFDSIFWVALGTLLYLTF